MQAEHHTDRAGHDTAGRDASVTPLATPMTVTRLREWVRTAQPNARLPYALGGVVAHGCTAAVAEAVRELAEKGYLTPHRMKVGPGQVVQIVQRTNRPVPRGIAVL